MRFFEVVMKLMSGWSREDKLNEDKKHFSDKVANMKVPTNLNIK